MEYSFRTASVKILPSTFGIIDIQKILQVPFLPLNKSGGFRLLSSSDERKFLFQYLHEVPITYGEFNGDYTLKTETRVKEITFEIDIKSKRMIVFSNKAQSDFFVRKFMSQFGYLISSFELDFTNLIDKLTTSEIITHSEQVVINGFIFKDIIVGKYIAEIKDLEILQQIVSEYGPKVDKIKLSIIYDDTDSIISIDRNGSFLFNCFREDNINILNYFIDTALTGRL
ncbi:hypothetical protein SAMN04488589_1187 [Methanolobus vulcani]|jgi:hypothetical protein|uniref:Uncharacterized protein n=1 Tax=Methanolobus vulcani TaxID=38026 RepID=A0A7Z7AW03_9EURY|nr:hypothetical protein [Methanolobus vulcani]SDF70778.1 hypothetical protein SAMN04488589_1187 [Methanolobus vulcani]